MMQAKASGWLITCLLGLLVWASDAHPVPCQNNIPASNPDWVYIDHGDGTVTDTRTGLMWKQCVEGLSGASCQTGSQQIFTWAEALVHAEASTFANYNDWRLPNVKELSSLVEECRAGPSINTNRFPNTPNSGLFSSSPDARSPLFSAFVWVVSFDDGANEEGLRGGTRGARLVRGGQ